MVLRFWRVAVSEGSEAMYIFRRAGEQGGAVHGGSQFDRFSSLGRPQLRHPFVYRGGAEASLADGGSSGHDGADQGGAESPEYGWEKRVEDGERKAHSAMAGGDPPQHVEAMAAGPARRGRARLRVRAGPLNSLREEVEASVGEAEGQEEVMQWCSSWSSMAALCILFLLIVGLPPLLPVLPLPPYELMFFPGLLLLLLLAFAAMPDAASPSPPSPWPVAPSSRGQKWAH